MVERPIVEPDDPDHLVVEHVLNYYHATLKQNPEALGYLQRRGLTHPELLDNFKLGFSDRTLGLRIPLKNRKAGRALREQLQRLGLMRSSGHEYFRGAITVPVYDQDGRVAEVYGRRIDPSPKRGVEPHLFVPDPPRGVFNLAALTSRDMIVTRGVIDALTCWCHELRNVTCAWGLDGFTEEHLAAFTEHAVERVFIAFDRTTKGDLAAGKLANLLAARGMQAFRVVLPQSCDVNDFAVSDTGSERDLAALVRNATWLAGTKPQPVSAPSATPTTSQPDIPPSFLTPPATSDVHAEQREHEVVMQFGDRRWRIRGLDRNTSFERMKVNVLVSREHSEISGFHADVLEMYSARQRAAFIREAASEIGHEERVLKADLAKVLLELERLQEEHMRRLSEPNGKRDVTLTDAERDAALALLRDPNLLERVLDDYEQCGLVGERDNALIAYLVATSRFLDHPLAAIIQSASSAGKSSLMEAVLAFIPDESRVSYSALTSQALYYMPEANLRHKVLAIAEQEGADSAAYALKLLQSEGALTIASTGRDTKTGRHVTHDYRVEGPVAVVLTTTSLNLDEELLNRCLVLAVDEGAEQTRKIHEAQRRAETLEGFTLREERARVVRLHQNAQRLLSPIRVVNPYATGLQFAGTRTRSRRDHAKYLAIIRASALLHQHQRPVRAIDHDGAELRYIEATEADIALAERLFNVLRPGLEELPPQTQRLLTLVGEYVHERADREGVEPEDVRFTRREIRERTGWAHSQLAVHLARLQDLEHLLVHSGGARRRYVYQYAVCPGSVRPLSGGGGRTVFRNEHGNLPNLSGVPGVRSSPDATSAGRTYTQPSRAE